LVIAGDEVPLERDELPKVSGSLSHLLSGGFGGGIGGGSLSNSTCTSTGDPAANVKLNCDDPTSPDNETPVIADPLDPNHLLAADNYPSSPHYGRLYLSWDQIELDKGALDRSPVVLSYSDDAGKSWSRPVEISGSNPVYCTANQGPVGPPGACDESFFSYGAVRPNGDVVVGFINQ